MINSVTKECNLKQEYTILNCIFYDVITLVLYCKSDWLVNYPENNLKDEFSSNVPQVAQVLKPGSRNSAARKTVCTQKCSDFTLPSLVSARLAILRSLEDRVVIMTD